MYVGELKKLLKKLPNDMMIVVDMEDGRVLPMCHQSGMDILNVVNKEEIDQSKGEALEIEGTDVPVFVIKPCTCVPDEIELGEINSQPELN